MALGDGTSVADALPEWKGRAILLVDLDAFFASVEQLDHPAWRGRPVIVGGDPEKHGVVSTCSYEARAFGVRSAMPSSTAARLCPEAIWSRGHFDRYKQLSDQIMDILRDETPFVQQVSIDEAFCDVTPTRANRDHPHVVAARIQRRVAQLGVTCSIGVGVSKSVAKVASDIDKPHGLTVVYPGREADFLAPLPLRSMSGIGAVSEKALKVHGIRTLGEVACAEERVLRDVFGKNAQMMRERCCGADRDGIVMEDPVKSISNEMTFSDEVTSWEDARAALVTLLGKVGRRMRRKKLQGRILTVKVRFHDRSLRSAQRHLSHPSDDELELIALAERLLGEIWGQAVPIRLLGVALSGFEAEQTESQATLFDVALEAPKEEDALPVVADKAKRRGLLAATDAMREKFGDDAITFGSEMRIAQRGTGTGSKGPADYRK